MNELTSFLKFAFNIGKIKLNQKYLFIESDPWDTIHYVPIEINGKWVRCKVISEKTGMITYDTIRTRLFRSCFYEVKPPPNQKIKIKLD